jgi:hypothetical protein
MAERFDSISERAHKMVQLAREEAQRPDFGYVGVLVPEPRA